MTAPVTVVSCLYGSNGHERFISQWAYAIGNLDPAPQDVLVLTDRVYDIPGPVNEIVVQRCDWKHPQAYYLQRAFDLALTPWVWIVDIDDLAMPDALIGLEDVEADVWMAGYHSEDGHYVPQPMTAVDVLEDTRNQIPAGSFVRMDAFGRSGGFPDVAFQDWGLWRRLAASGATFATSGCVQYQYVRHTDTRSYTELTPEARDWHLYEMLASEFWRPRELVGIVDKTTTVTDTRYA